MSPQLMLSPFNGTVSAAAEIKLTSEAAYLSARSAVDANDS